MPHIAAGTRISHMTDQFAQRKRRPFLLTGVGDHCLGQENPLGCGPGRTAFFLDDNGFHSLSGCGNAIGHLVDVCTLAAQTHQQYGSQVRVFSKADKRIVHTIDINRGLAAALMVKESRRPLHL